MGNKRSKPQISAPTKAKAKFKTVGIQEANKDGSIFFTATDRIRTFLLCSMRAQKHQSAFHLSLMYRERSIALRILHYIFTEIEACMPFTKLRKQLVSSEKTGNFMGYYPCYDSRTQCPIWIQEPLRHENKQMESVEQFKSQSLKFPLVSVWGWSAQELNIFFLVCKMTVFAYGNTQIRRMLLLMRQNLPLREPLYDAILTLRVYTILDKPQWIWKMPSVYDSPECFVSHDIAYVVLAAMDQHHNDVAIQVLGLETLNALW